MVRIYLINNLISLDSVPNMLTIQLIRRSTSMKENLVALMIELKDHLKLILTLITLKLYIYLMGTLKFLVLMDHMVHGDLKVNG